MKFNARLVWFALLLMSLPVSPSRAFEPMGGSLLGVREQRVPSPRGKPAAAQLPAERTCRAGNLTADLRIGRLSGVGIGDIADTARALGVTLVTAKLGGILVQEYQIAASGCMDALQAFARYLERMSAPR